MPSPMVRLVDRLWKAASTAILAALLVTGCAPIEADDEVAVLGATSGAVVNGERDPGAVTLTEGERLSIGWLHSRGYTAGNFCSATLITPWAVITAAHCVDGGSARRIAFGVGDFPDEAVGSFAVASVHRHDSLDAAVLLLEEDATERLPELEPIAFNREGLSRAWVGRAFDGAGYGDTRDRSYGRFFATLDIVGVGDTAIVVSGHGERGLCFGDSGGPALYQADGEAPRVLAVLSSGSTSCVGQDFMTRLDILAPWIEGIVGEPGAGPPTPPEPVDACGDIDYFGVCDGGDAVWCRDGDLRRRDCGAEGMQCGWVSDDLGYFCFDDARPADGCGDLDYAGECDGPVARWCDGGVPRERNCGAVQGVCAWIDDDIGYFCREPRPTDDVVTDGQPESGEPTPVDPFDEAWRLPVDPVAGARGEREAVHHEAAGLDPFDGDIPVFGPDPHSGGCAGGGTAAGWAILAAAAALTRRRRRR